jgi:hypothetical protein
MTRCTKCERLILEPATTCGVCGAAGAVDVPTVRQDAAALPIVAPQAPEAAPIASVVPTVPVIPPSRPVLASAPPALATPPVMPVAAPAAAAAAAPAPTTAPVTVAPATLAAVPPTPATPVPAAVAAAPATARTSNRRMLLAALLVVAGGSLTFAMLRSSTPAVPVTAPDATNNPAAPKGAAPKPAPAARSTSAAVHMPSKWNAANRDWLANAKRGVAFELRSLNKVAIWQSIAQPILVVRCEAGRMQTFVYTASALQMEAIDQNHAVKVSFDGEPESNERWADSSEHDALFAPDAAAFTRRLAASQTLKISYMPHNASRAVAQFQTHGLSDLLEPAAKQCGWTK